VLKSQAHQELQEWQHAVVAYLEAFALLPPTPRTVNPEETRDLLLGLAKCAYEAKDYERAVWATDHAIGYNRNHEESTCLNERRTHLVLISPFWRRFSFLFALTHQFINTRLSP
jgi:hypothetical protein